MCLWECGRSYARRLFSSSFFVSKVCSGIEAVEGWVWGLGNNLKSLVDRHIDSIRQFPDSRFAQALPALMSQSSLTMLQFDSIISVHSAGSSPPFPFNDVWAYTRTRRATTRSTRSVYPSWRSNRTTIRSLSVRRRVMTGTSGSRSLSLAGAATWAGSSLVGRRTAGPGAPRSSGSRPRERVYAWSPEK
jgi:hypothetical protein